MTRALGIIWFIGILINGMCYMALLEEKPVRSTCIQNGAFAVLASAVNPQRVR